LQPPPHAVCVGVLGELAQERLVFGLRMRELTVALACQTEQLTRLGLFRICAACEELREQLDRTVEVLAPELLARDGVKRARLVFADGRCRGRGSRFGRWRRVFTGRSCRTNQRFIL
jgi:hypothetical protein